MGRFRWLLLEVTAPVPEPHALRAHHFRVQSRTARVQVSNRHRDSEYNDIPAGLQYLNAQNYYN